MNAYVHVRSCNLSVYQIGPREVAVGIAKKIIGVGTNCKWGSGGGQTYLKAWKAAKKYPDDNVKYWAMCTEWLLNEKVTRFPIINLRRNWFCPCEFLCWNRSICQRRNLRGFFFFSFIHFNCISLTGACMCLPQIVKMFAKRDSVWYSYFVRTATCASTSTQIISM